MKILIFSDSHGDTYAMRKAMSLHSDAAYAVFLGDGLHDAETVMADYPGTTLIAVRGNCDLYGMDYPTERVFFAKNKKIFLCHGHTVGVKSGLGGLIGTALRENADIALYGHTHVPSETYLSEYARPLYLFNPGSARKDTAGRGHYGILLIEGENILFSHATA